MALGRSVGLVMGGLLLGGALGAQQPEPASLGLQLRANLPMGDLRNAVGGTLKPGFGGSLVMEEDFLDGCRGRIGLGTDVWLKGKWLDKPGVQGSVSAVHLSVEAVRLLHTDADAPLVGPYVLAGLGLYVWSLTSEDTLASTKVTRQVTHMGASFGFGWRFSAHQDLELKALMGKVEPEFTALTLTAGITFRY